MLPRPSATIKTWQTDFVDGASQSRYAAIHCLRHDSGGLVGTFNPGFDEFPFSWSLNISYLRQPCTGHQIAGCTPGLGPAGLQESVLDVHVLNSQAPPLKHTGPSFGPVRSSSCVFRLWCVGVPKRGMMNEDHCAWLACKEQRFCVRPTGGWGVNPRLVVCFLLVEGK